MKTEHLVKPPKPAPPHIRLIHRRGPDAPCEKQMPGFVTRLDEVNHRCVRQRGAEKMYNLSKSNRVISEGCEEATGRKCMEVLAGPAHQNEVCEGLLHSLGCDSGLFYTALFMQLPPQGRMLCFLQ